MSAQLMYHSVNGSECISSKVTSMKGRRSGLQLHAEATNTGKLSVPPTVHKAV